MAIFNSTVGRFDEAFDIKEGPSLSHSILNLDLETLKQRNINVIEYK